MGRRKVYGYGDRGIKNRAALEQTFMLWLTIIVGIPVVVVGFIADNFVAVLNVGAACAAFLAVCWIMSWAADASIAYCDKLSKRAWASILARFSGKRP